MHRYNKNNAYETTLLRLHQSHRINFSADSIRKKREKQTKKKHIKNKIIDDSEDFERFDFLGKIILTDLFDKSLFFSLSNKLQNHFLSKFRRFTTNYIHPFQDDPLFSLSDYVHLLLRSIITEQIIRERRIFHKYLIFNSPRTTKISWRN